MLEKNDEYYMTEALKEAAAAFDHGETPIGAVVVHQGRILGRAYNQIETLKDATAHAEMIAITQASNAVGDWRLEECGLYVTNEPCIMCYGAILLSRIKKLVYGVSDDRGWGMSNMIHPGLESLRERLVIKAGVLEQECKTILKEFFSKIRKGRKP
jgi:tRNA(adenine34) deaminase